eukprot:gene27432-36085_t
MAFCGLTQEKLDEKSWINSDQKCTAKCAGGVECSKYYSEHSAKATSIGFSIPTYNALFHLGHRKKYIQFNDFDTMLSQLHEHWPVLKVKHDLVVVHNNFKDKKITNDQSLREIFESLLGNNSDIHLYVDMNSQGFSWYAKNPVIALERIHSSEFLISEEAFALDDIINEQQYDLAVNILCADLIDRIRVLDLEQSSEYTMRELISPILIRALCLVDDISNGKANENKVRLICEKV